MVDNSSYRIKPHMLSFVDSSMGPMLENFTQMRSINDLAQETYMSGITDVLIASIGPTKVASTDENKDFYYRNSKLQGQKNAVHYDRCMHLYCLNGKYGNNHFNVFLGKGQNTMFFGSSKKYRDTFCFSELILFLNLNFVLAISNLFDTTFFHLAGPGGLILIEGLMPITNWTSAGTPIVTVTCGVRPVVLKPEYRTAIPDIPLSTTSNYMHFFRYGGVKIRVDQFSLLSIACSGRYCDALGSYSNGRLAPKCACYKVEDNDDSIVGLYQLTITNDAGLHLKVSDHTSKTFFYSHIKSGGVASRGVNPDEVNNNRMVRLSMNTCISDQVQFINDNCGGFIIEGWIRQGMIDDQALAEDGVRKKDLEKMKNNDITYHITTIQVCDDASYQAEREALKFDFDAALDYASPTNMNTARNASLAALPDFTVGRRVAARTGGAGAAANGGGAGPDGMTGGGPAAAAAAAAHSAHGAAASAPEAASPSGRASSSARNTRNNTGGSRPAQVSQSQS